MTNISFLSILIIMSIILLEGCNVNQNEDISDKETTSKIKEVTVSFIDSHYNDIKSVEVQDPYLSPMGGIQSEGTVNDELKFTITVSESYEVTGISVDENFPKMKDECKESNCSY